MHRRSALALCLVALTGSASACAVAVAETPGQKAADHAAGGGERLELAREELGFEGRAAPRRRIEARDIEVELERSEAVAGSHTPIAVVVDGPAGRSADVEVTLPARFTDRTPRGSRFVRTRTTRGGRSALDGRELTIPFRGTRTRVEIPDRGLPAGTYRFAVRIDRVAHGTLGLRLYAPAREAREAPGSKSPYAVLRAPSIASATISGATESESFVTVSPLDPDRLLAGFNENGAGDVVASLSTDGGRSYAPLRLPTAVDAPGTTEQEGAGLGGDPMSAADLLGNIWYGQLTRDGGTAPSRIVVNRVDPETNAFQPQDVGLKFNVAGQQDKPMMTIDNAPASPTFGRLYVAWSQPGTSGGVRMVLASCDTRSAGFPVAARCDDADNWTQPVDVYPGADAEGSYIYADVAVGVDGTVFFVNWDYSARNAVLGATCTAEPRTRCGEAGSFSAPKVIATLQEDPVAGPVPFACPTFAAPGGRTGVATSVKTDTSDGPERGRVWVAWDDLRPGSGTTRCGPTSSGDLAPPRTTDLTWDPWVASARGALPGGSAPSSAVATRLSTDAGSTFGSSDDDWFPWLAVDAATGEAHADWYSTRGDPSRRTSEFHLARLTATGDAKPVVADDSVVSTTRSDFSDQTCCFFGNDYGDYTGLDAAQGVVVPTWISSPAGGGGDDGDALLRYPTDMPLQVVHDAASATEDVPAGADGDGVVEPGEPVIITERVRNTSAQDAKQVAGVLSSPVPGVRVTQGSSAYPDLLRGGGTGSGATPFTAVMPAGAPCGSVVDFDVRLAAQPEQEVVIFLVPLTCSNAPPIVPPVPTTTTTTGATPTIPIRPGLPTLPLRVSLSVDRTQRKTIRTRGPRARIGCTRACTATLELRLSPRTAKRLGLRSIRAGKATLRFSSSGRRSVVLRLSLPAATRLKLTRDRRAAISVLATVRAAAGGTRRTVTKAVPLAGKG